LLVATIRRLEAAGKRVILVAPLPRSNFDPGACYLRAEQRVLTLGRDSCDIARAELFPWYGEVVAKLRRLAPVAGAALFVPEDVLCDGRTCATRRGGVILYRDRGHLTRDGSIYLVRRLGLADRLARERAAVPPPQR
jgi:hypothetical protein